MRSTERPEFDGNQRLENFAHHPDVAGLDDLAGGAAVEDPSRAP
jgi:hypothetical protein